MLQSRCNPHNIHRPRTTAGTLEFQVTALLKVDVRADGGEKESLINLSVWRRVRRHVTGGECYFPAARLELCQQSPHEAPLDDNMETKSQREQSKDFLCLHHIAGPVCCFQVDFEVSICNSRDKMKLFHIYDFYLLSSGSAVFRLQQLFNTEEMKWSVLRCFPIFNLHPRICLNSHSQTGPCMSQLVNAWLAQGTESNLPGSLIWR